MEQTKEIHIKLPPEVHHRFICKCANEGTKMSKKLRLWIEQFLRGELK